MTAAPKVTTAAAGTVRQDEGNGEGERRRDTALDLLRERRAALVRHGCRLLAARLLEAGTATMDDIAGELDTPPDCDRRLLGAIPSTLAKAGVAELTGYIRSTRPERHASVLAVWQLTDRDAALSWLDAHPDLLDDLPNLDEGERRQLAFGFHDETPTAPTAAGVRSC